MSMTNVKVSVRKREKFNMSLSTRARPRETYRSRIAMKEDIMGYAQVPQYTAQSQRYVFRNITNLTWRSRRTTARAYLPLLQLHPNRQTYRVKMTPIHLLDKSPRIRISTISQIDAMRCRTTGVQQASTSKRFRLNYVIQNQENRSMPP